MQSITIITPSNIEVEYRLAGAASRLAAFIIDFTLQVMAILLVFLVVWQVTDTLDGAALGFILVVGFIIFFGYFIICEMTMNGQSIGKRIFGLRVIRDNGQPIDFTQSLVRGLIRSSIDMMYVGLFTMLFSKKHKRLGDMAAGTIVIIEKHDNTHEPSLFKPQYDWPQNFPDPLTLTEHERQLVEEWIRRRDTLPSYGMDIELRFREYFKSKEPINTEYGN
ncbi:MAG: RDD family protein [Defluviitaleaceae bacterium]|nr:RDD family protein [Defluviitaleaceae bacterium]